MRAIVHDRYGPPDVLYLEDVPRPEPKADELLVRVHVTTVTQTDRHQMRDSASIRLGVTGTGRALGPSIVRLPARTLAR